MLFDFDDLLYGVFEPEVDENVEKPTEELVELNLVPTENTVITTLTPHTSKSETLNSPVSYSSLPPIDVFKTSTKLPTEMIQRAKKEQADKDEIRRRRIRESAAKHRQKKLAQLTEMRAEVKRLTDSISKAKTEQEALKAELEQSRTELSMMNSHYNFQPVQYQPTDCNQLKYQADFTQSSGQLLIQIL